MGGNNSTPTPKYSKIGIILGQAMQYKNFTKNCDLKVIENVKSSDLKGKKYLITGASSGLGKTLTKILLTQGASIIMVSRSQERLEKAKQEICQEIINEKSLPSNDINQFEISIKTLDLCNIQQVQEFCHQMLQDNIELDGLINNGGALPLQHKTQPFKGQDLEETLCCHVISPHLINMNLYPLLEKKKGILINNTSAGAYSQQLDNLLVQRQFIDCIQKPSEKDKNEEKKYHDGALVYAQCKRAMLEETTMMADYLNGKNSSVKIISIHPGWAVTPGLDALYESKPAYKKYKFRPSIDAAYGMAYPIVNQQKMENGKFYYDGEEQPEHKLFAGTTVDDQERKKLWDYLQQFKN